MLDSKVQLQKFAILAGLALMAMKFGAWWITNSNAILTDALESIVNIVAGSFALYSLVLSSKPRDDDHPYGHGKVEFLSAGFEASLITLAGIGIIFKAVYNIFYPEDISQLDIGMLLVAISGLVNYMLGYFLEAKGKKSRSITLIASGQHLKSDSYTSVGLLVGLLVLYLTGIRVLDNIIAIAMGLFILYTGFRLLRESIAGIMDEADPELIKEVVECLEQNREENWIDVHNFRIIKYGSTLHFDCHMTLPWYFNTIEAHNEVDALEKWAKENCDTDVELFVHVDSCEPNSCVLCQKKECKFREFEFQKRVVWTVDKVVANKRHGRQEGLLESNH